MIGAVVGDIIGSIYAFSPIKTKNFELFDIRDRFTDDTIFLAAVANVTKKYLAEGKTGDYESELKEEFLRLTWIYEDMAYSRHYSGWMFEDEPKAYPSAGIIPSSRAVAVGFLASSIEEAEELGEKSCVITHNHAEAIKGAKCVAGVVFLAKQKTSKQEILQYVTSKYYEMNFNLKGIRLRYEFLPTAPMGVPPAIMAFLEGEGFEDTIRNAISIGGSDSLCAIAGGIADAYYGVPDDIKEKALLYLDDELRSAFVE